MEATELTWADKLLQQGRMEGRLEGREEGELQAKREIMLRQAQARFGRVPEDAAALLAAADGATLDRLLERIVQVGSLAEFLAELAEA